MPAIYADASALMKLVADEPLSDVVGAFVRDAEVFSSELILAEIPRALRRIDDERPGAELGPMLERADELIGTITMAPVESLILEAAGELPEPALRTLDAIHVVAALYLRPIDAFLTYDVRQAASARLAGLRTVAPGL
ncbi:MAG TPA: type II toxin-antitoxin system VapC family toxin [Solirubrobacterales bacterium]